MQAEGSRTEAERLEREERAARERAEESEIAAGGASHRHGEQRRRLEALEETLIDARGRAEDAARDSALAQEDVSRALAVVRDQSGEVKAAESRLHTIEELENSLEGHVPGTRAIVEAWQRGDLSGIEGIVSNLITTEERYARAMDVAFGARLSNVVTTTSEDAERAVEFLVRKEAGRATFLPLDTLSDRKGRRLDPEIGRIEGVLGYAHTLVKTTPRFEGIVTFLVGNVLIVDTLDTGIELVRGRGLRDTIVTLGGEQITGGGAITGGRFQRERSILSRRFQAASLREALVGMRARLDEAERGLRTAHLRAESAIVARDAARDLQATTESQLVGLRAEIAALAGEVERARADLETAQATANELRAEALRSRAPRARVRTGRAGGRAQRRSIARSWSGAGTRARGIARAQDDQVAASAHAADLRERAAALSAERDAAKARLGMLDANSERAGAAREEMLAEITSLMEETRSTHARAEGLRRGVSSLDERLEAARRQRESLAGRQTQLESDLRTAEQEERDTTAGGERQRMRLARARSRARDARVAVRAESGDERRVRRRLGAIFERTRRGGGRVAAFTRRTRAPAGERQSQRRRGARRTGRAASVPARSARRPREGARDAARVDSRDRGRDANPVQRNVRARFGSVCRNVRAALLRRPREDVANAIPRIFPRPESRSPCSRRARKRCR